MNEFGLMAFGQIGETDIEICDRVERIGHGNVEDDLIGEQHGDCPVHPFGGVDADGENWLWHAPVLSTGGRPASSGDQRLAHRSLVTGLGSLGRKPLTRRHLSES
jgi:hypothetical protein